MCQKLSINNTVIWESLLFNFFVGKIFVLKYFSGSWQRTKI